MYRVNKKKLGLVAFWPILVYFFFRTSWLPKLLKILKILKFFDFPKGVKKKFLDFLEIEKTFENKIGVIFEFMSKSQFWLNYVGYFLKKWQKSASHFSRIFLNISQSTGQKTVKISQVSILRLFYRLALSSVEKIQR